MADQALLARVLKSQKDVFWQDNASLSEDERQRQWAIQTADLASLLTANVPPPLHSSIEDQTASKAALPKPVSKPRRRRNSQATVPQRPITNDTTPSPEQMWRKRSSSSQYGPAPNPFVIDVDRPATPLVLEQWKSNTSDEPYNGLATSTTDSPVFKKRNLSLTRPSIQIPTTVYDNPADFINQSQFADQSTNKCQSTLSPNFSPRPVSRRNSNQSRFPPSPYAFSSTMSRSPTTTTISDSVTIATPATSVNMSRDPSLCSAMNKMCRVKSQVSNLDLNTGDLSDTFNTQSTFNDTQDTDMASFDASLSVSHVGGMADAVNSFSVSDFAKSSSLPFIAEHGIAMSRSGSAESNASSKSSRVSRRIQEVALSVRPIQPKEAGGEPMSHQPSSSSSSSYEMARVRFEDGSKVGIPKNRGYVRPTRDKVMCPNCNVKPEGFRGPHELRRHIDVVHAKTRKAFVCIDRSSDLMFLAKCKACKERKKYHAEYNAAAHLRRIHFNPKPKGAKGKKAAQGRGGNGGGDEPKLEILRLWFEEVEEVVTKDMPPIKDDDEEEDDPASFVPGSTPQELLFSGPDYEDYGSLSSGNNDATFGINFPCSSEQQQVYQPNDYTSASFSTAAATTSAIAIIHPQTAKSMFMWPNSATSHLDNIDSSNLSPDLSSFLPSNGDRLALSANETVSKADNLFEVSEDFDFSKSYDSPLYNASSFDELFTFNLSS